MDRLKAEALEGHPLRTWLAFGARSARRVFPLVRANGDKRELLYTAIVVAAEEAAGGAPPNFPYPGRLFEFAPEGPAEGAAQSIGRAAVLAGRAVAVFDELDCASAINEAEKSLIDFRAAIDQVVQSSREVAAASPEIDGKKAEQALEYDWRILAGTQLSGDDWLGDPVAADASGPFGELWPNGDAPSWNGRRDRSEALSIEPQIITGERFASDDETPVHADIVCWQLSRGVGESVESVIAVMDKARKRYEESGRHPPVFVIHAPEIEREDGAKLIMAGATLLADAHIGDQSPENSEMLAEALAKFFRRDYAAWKQTDALWWYDDSLRTGPSPRAPQPFATRYPARSPQFSGWDPSHEVPGGADAYKWLIEKMQPTDMRIEKEAGWPTES